MPKGKFWFEPMHDTATEGGIKVTSINVLSKKGVVAVLRLTGKGIAIESKVNTTVEAELFVRVGKKGGKAFMDLRPNFGQSRKRVAIILQ
jgi:hypothetical protein